MASNKEKQVKEQASTKKEAKKNVIGKTPSEVNPKLLEISGGPLVNVEDSNTYGKKEPNKEVDPYCQLLIFVSWIHFIDLGDKDGERSISPSK